MVLGMEVKVKVRSRLRGERAVDVDAGEDGNAMDENEG